MNKCITCTQPSLRPSLCTDCRAGKADHYLPPLMYRGETSDSQQVGGDHYTRLQVQPWAAMEAWMSREEFAGFLRGNAIKYLARDKGNRLEDLKKARHYLDKLIEVTECPST